MLRPMILIAVALICAASTAASETVKLDELKTGKKGVVVYHNFRTYYIDGITYTLPKGVRHGWEGDPVKCEVSEVSKGDRGLLLKVLIQKDRYLWADLPTKDIVDGAKITLSMPFSVHGTKRVSGRTIWHLIPIGPKEKKSK